MVCYLSDRMEITYVGFFKGIPCVVVCDYSPLILLLCWRNGFSPDGLSLSSRTVMELRNKHITPLSFGKPILTSFCLSLPFCNVNDGIPNCWEAVVTECFQHTLQSHLGQALQLCKVLYYFPHAASSSHSPQAELVMVKDPCQKAFAGSLGASAMSLEGTCSSSFVSAPRTLMPLCV